MSLRAFPTDHKNVPVNMASTCTISWHIQILKVFLIDVSRDVVFTSTSIDLVLCVKTTDYEKLFIFVDGHHAWSKSTLFCFKEFIYFEGRTVRIN